MCRVKWDRVGPYFFDEDGTYWCTSEFQTLCYKATQCFVTTSWSFGNQRGTIHTVSTKYGATAHASMAVVREMFPQHLISRHCDLRWPARSPDLSVCLWLLLVMQNWLHLKWQIDSRKSRSVNDRKACNMCRNWCSSTKAMENFEERILMWLHEVSVITFCMVDINVTIVVFKFLRSFLTTLNNVHSAVRS